METKVIDNFGGKLTRIPNGDMNSGFCAYSTSNSYDPFSSPRNLTWQETATRIDNTGTSSITGLIVAGKERIESGLSYVYAVDHTAKLYKIQVNSSVVASIDNPSLIGTLTSGSPTFTRGGSMDFFGATEKIYIGHDKGVNSVNFDGSGDTAVTSISSITATVPRPLQQFVGKLYFGNGNNIGEIDSTATVTNYNRFSPALPVNTQIRDLDLTPEGNYMEAVVTEASLGDITSVTPDTGEITHSNSYIAKWNGTDAGYTALTTFNGYTLTANHIFGSRAFKFGYDLPGAALYHENEKVVSPIFARSPLPNAASSTGNLLGWGTPEFNSGFMKMSIFLYGPLDNEYINNDWFRHFQMSASGSETDVIRVPFGILTSNLSFGASSNGYGGGVYGSGKMYFSTLENATGTPGTGVYKFYKWFNVPTGTGTAAPGVYETQTQLFSKKMSVSEVRIYGKPWVANNEFTIALIGSDGNAITGGSKTFTAGSTLTIGDDFAWYSPDTAPVYAIGVRITNSGSVNHTIKKIELDLKEAGK